MCTPLHPSQSLHIVDGLAHAFHRERDGATGSYSGWPSFVNEKIIDVLLSVGIFVQMVEMTPAQVG